MTTTKRAYGGVSADDRRQARRTQLVSAVLDVVGADGVSGVTVDGVCAAAGLTKRYFYESFTNVDVALVAVLDRAYVDLGNRMTAVVETLGTAAERTRAVVEILVDTLAADPRLARLYVEATGHTALRGRRDAAVAQFSDLLRFRASPTGRAPDRQLLAVRLVVAGTTDLVTGWLSGVIAADRESVIDTIVAAALAASQPGERKR